MEFDIQTLMLIFFILFLILSIGKIWAFLPNEQLEDDDTTEEARAELLRVMLLVIKEAKGERLSKKGLYEKMKRHKEFNTKRFWRFNLNRLKHLLNAYYLKHPETKTIEDIYNSMLQEK